KDNPLGTSFLAIGTFLLMDNEGESYERYLRSKSSLAYSDYKNKAIATGERLGERVESISQGVRSKTEHLARQGEEKITHLKNAGRDLKEQVRGKISSKAHEVKDNVIDASETFRERAASTLSSADEVTEEVKLESNNMMSEGGGTQ